MTFRLIPASVQSLGVFSPTGGNVVDSSGTISFGSTALRSGTLQISSGVLSDTSGTISCGATSLVTTGNVSAARFLASSDERLKEQIQPLTTSIVELRRLLPATYHWKESGLFDSGFIAQQVQGVAPECVQTHPDTGFLSVDYARLVPNMARWLHLLTDRINKLEGIC